MITSVVDTVEPASKTGATDLAILSFVGELFSGEKETDNYADDNADKIESSVTNKSITYFNQDLFRSTLSSVEQCSGTLLFCMEST
jgi:hypothetical protein